MGQLLAILSSNPERTRCQLHRLRSSVAMGSERQALGLGYFVDDAVLLAKRPAGVGSRDVATLAHDIRSATLIAASQDADVRFDEDAVDPFRFRRWVFAMDGVVEGFEELRGRVAKVLPELIARQIRSTVDREHVFGLLLAQLKEQGRLDDADLPPAEAARCLAFAVRDLDRLAREAGSTRPTPLVAIASNGRVLIAVRRGRPLAYALLEGLAACAPCGLDEKTPERDSRLTSHRRSKAVAVASAPAAGSGFIEVPDGSVVAVGRGLEITVASI